MSLKQKIIAAIIALGALLIFIFNRGIFSHNPKLGLTPSSQTITTQATPEPKSSDQLPAPDVVSTKPSPLDGCTITPTQTIEITFNRPLENVGEFKSSIDPKIDYDVKLSNDKKTVKITPTKNFGLGQGYTFDIKPFTQFQPKKSLGRDITFHFTTINYSGV